MKIAKHIQQAGLASRRVAESWVVAGRVQVEGQVMTNPATRLSDPATILLDGKKLPPPPAPQLWLYHKPVGLLVSRTDPQGRKVIFDEPVFKKLPAAPMAVGRLDLASEGLLLLTNSGALARTLELPETGLIRKYRLRVFGFVRQSQLDKLERGVEVAGVRYQGAVARLEKIPGANNDAGGRNRWLTIELKEGKNREVRVLMESLGLQVNRLIRQSYGPFKLGKLKSGELTAADGKQIKKWLPSL